MALHKKLPQGVQAIDPVWSRVREEAEECARREPALASFIFTTVLNHDSLEHAIAHRVAARLGSEDVSSELIVQAFREAIEAEQIIGAAMRADIVAVAERDPATTRYLEPVLYYKGFHALQAHRLAHYLWNRGRKDFALYLQSQSSSVFGVDINPNTKVGKGIFIDHATGVVIGQTAVIEDDVSILQGVTLGGTGKEQGDRHPKIRRGVLLSAGAKVLGNIEVGSCARVAAGSVVLKPVPANVTVAGVPARVVGDAGCRDSEPARSMNQMFDMPFMGESI
ncbi:MAG: serine O-acetyltransferase [Rhizobiales bacterium]|jgi:serine O-acetyltransferase|nr:serine O-acetyltransferase [Hyphomicrobiales bacterium]